MVSLNQRGAGCCGGSAAARPVPAPPPPGAAFCSLMASQLNLQLQFSQTNNKIVDVSSDCKMISLVTSLAS